MDFKGIRYMEKIANRNCKYCKGSGKVDLFSSRIDCDCCINKDLSGAWDVINRMMDRLNEDLDAQIKSIPD